MDGSEVEVEVEVVKSTDVMLWNRINYYYYYRHHGMKQVGVDENAN